jgi:hypothetical protein
LKNRPSRHPSFGTSTYPIAQSAIGASAKAAIAAMYS